MYIDLGRINTDDCVHRLKASLVGVVDAGNEVVVMIRVLWC